VEILLVEFPSRFQAKPKSNVACVQRISFDTLQKDFESVSKSMITIGTIESQALES